MGIIVDTELYNIEFIGVNKVKFSGIFRLESPIKYLKIFQEVLKVILNNKENVVFDISELQFLNSSGITAFCRMVILARDTNKQIDFIYEEEIPWQPRFLRSIKRLMELKH